MSYKDFLANDDDYAKAKKKNNLIVFIVAVVIILIVGTVMAVAVWNNRNTDEGNYYAFKENEDIESASGNSVSDNSTAEAEETYELVPCGIEIEKSEYDRLAELARKNREKGELNKKELCELLGAMAYQYDWMEERDDEKLASFDEFMTTYRDWLMYMHFDEMNYNAFFNTINSLYVDEDIIKAIEENLFAKIVYAKDYYNFTYNDILYSFYDFYINKGLAENDNKFIGHIMNTKNIPIYNYNSHKVAFNELKMFNSMWSTNQIINKGYNLVVHIIPLKGDIKYYSLEDGSAKDIVCKYAVPIVAGIEETKMTKEIFIVFLDENFQMIDIIPYNSDNFLSIDALLKAK